MTPESLDSSATRGRWALDPEVVHFNAGPSGAMSRAVLEEQAELTRRAAANPHRFTEWEAFEGFDRSRRVAATLIGAPEHDIAFAPNVTNAMTSVLASIKLQESDEVLTTDHSYATIAASVRRRCVQTGAAVVEAAIDLTMSDDEVVQCVDAHVSDHTRLAVIDHVSSSTGMVLPIAAIAESLKRRGVLVVVDGAHAVATMPLSVTTLGADVWVGSCHKWLGAPPACAVMYVEPSLQSVIEPLVASHFFSMGFPGSFGFQGAVDHSARLCVPAAVQVYEELGWDRVWEHTTQLAGQGRHLVAEASGFEPVPTQSFQNITALRIPPRVTPDLEAGWKFADRLGREQHCEVAVTPWRDQVLLRLAVHATNTIDDFVLLGHALRSLIT